MPFKSEKQRRWMWANEPEMAEKWEKEEGDIDEADEESTIKYNANPALKGKQTTLPDALQKGIIDKESAKAKNEVTVKITKRQLRRIIKEALHGENKPLVLSGGPGKRIPGYHFDRVHQVHIRDDYDPRSDYADELGDAIKKVQDEELRNM